MSRRSYFLLPGTVSTYTIGIIRHGQISILKVYNCVQTLELSPHISPPIPVLYSNFLYPLSSSYFTPTAILTLHHNPNQADYLDLNARQHALNGNIRKFFQPFSDIIFQNIPWNKNALDLQISIDILLSRRPAILAIGETDQDKLQACHFPGYSFVQGRQTNPLNKKIRMNILVKDGLEFEEVDLMNEVPTCTIKFGGWNLCFCYREWSKGGDPDTADLPDQFARWDTMVQQWLTLSGRSMLIGDMNYCILHGNSPYQRRLVRQASPRMAKIHHDLP